MNDALKSQIQTYLPIVFLVVLVLLVGAYDPTFLSVNNFLTVTADTMTLFLMASGVTLVIMIGGIDLSIQAVASMSSCILAAYLSRARRIVDDPAGGTRWRWSPGFVGQPRFDQAPHPVLHRNAGGERRSAFTAGYWFSATKSRSTSPPDLSASYLSAMGRGARRSACPERNLGWRRLPCYPAQRYCFRLTPVRPPDPRHRSTGAARSPRPASMSTA
jgi:hypothetical protein